jgi:hypothetical protein
MQLVTGPEKRDIVYSRTLKMVVCQIYCRSSVLNGLNVSLLDVLNDSKLL